MSDVKTPFIFLHPHFKTGGSEVQTMLLARELVHRGIETHLVLHKAAGRMLERLPPQVEIHETGLESHAALPVIALRLNRIFSRFASGDVVVKLWASLLGVQLAARKNPQLRFVMCEDLDPLHHWQLIKFGYIKSHIIRRIFLSSPYVTANTESIADAMCEAYGLRTRPSVLYGGIDAPSIRELAGKYDAPTGLSYKKPLRIVTVASITVRKGYRRTLEALRHLEIPWTWDVVGDGPFRDELEKLTSSDPVRFHGVMANPYGLIAQADVLVHLPYSEAFGLAVLEAICLGTPVVASPCRGPLEIYDAMNQDHSRIRIVDPDNSAEVCEALMWYRHRDRPIPKDPPFTIQRAADGWLRYLGR